MDPFHLRPSEAFLSRSALRFNLQQIKSQIRSQNRLHRKDASVMAVVKADAYGHSLQCMLPQLSKLGVENFAVASIEEALEARKLNREARILILGGTFRWSRSTLDLLRKHSLEMVANDLSSLRILMQEQKIPVHLKLDTGMNRLGLKTEDWPEALRIVQDSKKPLKGLMTHYATFADVTFERQVMLFEELVRWFWQEGVRPEFVHSENSAALFSGARIKRGILSEVSNLVRPGLSLYGYHPAGVKSKVVLSPVLELVGRIDLIKSVDRGEGISYSHLYRANRSHPFGVVPIGYADGVSKLYLRALKPEWRDKNGRRKGSLNICGAVCMDMVMVRPAEGTGRRMQLKPKDQAVFWGRFPNLILKANLVEPYELNLRIAKRIPRVWVP